MVKLDIIRRPTRGAHFVGYLLKVNIDGKKYDLNIDFLVWSHIKPHEETTFSLRPEASPSTFTGRRSPVKKRKAPRGYFKKQYEYYWKPGIDEVKGCINTLSLPLTSEENPELFVYFFNHPIRFSRTYNERLQELQSYVNQHHWGVWSAPKWSEVNRKSLVPVAEVSGEADTFFASIFKSRLKKWGHEISD